MTKSTVFHQFLYFLLITAGVYLAFRYLLPLIFPFLLAYILIRILYPIMEFLHQKWHFPFFLSHYGTLFTFFAAITSLILFIIWKLLAQLRLLFYNFPIYRQLLGNTLYSQTRRICHCVDYYFRLDDGTILAFLEKQLEGFETTGTKLLTSHAGKTLLSCIQGSIHFFTTLVILIISMLLLVKEINSLHNSYRNSPFFSPVHSVLLRIKKCGLTYLKAESTILLLNWGIYALALFLIQNPYFILLGIFIAIFDAFPVLGSGMIFVPWSILEFLHQDYYSAAILITAYLITTFMREFLEARFLGNGLGINPFLMISAIFIGIELFGISGIFLGPLGIILIQALMELSSSEKEPLQTKKT